MVVHESINIFGGFAPFPNTIMIPTMGLQSDVIGFRFGFGYEKGKRTLRAMSNDQFNTLNEESEQAIYKEHDTNAILFFKQELNNWLQLQSEIIEKSVEIEKMKATRTPSAMAEIIQAMNTAVSAQGASVTWENLAETWNNFFGGGQVFNNFVNTSTTGQPVETTGSTTGQSKIGGQSPHTKNTSTPIKSNKLNIPQGFQIINGVVSKIPIQTQQASVTQKLPSASITFNSTLAKLQNDTQKTWTSMGIIKQNLQNAPGTIHLIQKQKVLTTLLAKQMKLTQNFLTISKNNSAIKALATQAFNKKAWLPVGGGQL